MLRGLYDRTMTLAETRYATLMLVMVAFIESSVFPIPPDVLLIPMVLAAPSRAWALAGIATIASVSGGALGYWIGAELLDSVGRPILALYGKTELYDAFAVRFNAQGAWAVLFAGITPFPYKVITITSGATGLDFWTFMVSSTVARGLRFFLVAALLWKIGPPARVFIEKRFGVVTLVFFAALLGGFALVKYL